MKIKNLHFCSYVRKALGVGGGGSLKALMYMSAKNVIFFFFLDGSPYCMYVPLKF